MSHPEVAKGFFSRYVSVYRRKYAEQANGLETVGLQDCVGLRAEDMSEYQVVQRDDRRLLLLPATAITFLPTTGTALFACGCRTRPCCISRDSGSV